MKSKNLTLWMTAIILLVSPVLRAQDSATPPAAVEESFARSFASATNVSWMSKNSICIATFRDPKLNLAYFEQNGNLYAHARWSPDLPLTVQNSLERARSASEKKYGTLSQRSVFEVAYATGETKYYVTYATKDNGSLILVSTNDGYICQKVRKSSNQGIVPAQSEIIASSH